MVRPQKRRRMQQQQMLESLRIGDDVLTAGGIYGQITGLGEDEVMLEIAPQLEVRVARRAVAGVTRSDAEPSEEPGDAEEHVGTEEPDDARAASPTDEHGG